MSVHVEAPAGPATAGYYRSILELQPACLARAAADGRFLAVNEAAQALLGASSLAEALGTTLPDLVPDDQRPGCLTFLAAVSGGQRGSLETTLVDLAGRAHLVEVHGVPHGALDGLPSALLTVREVTGRRELEAAVENAARLKEKLTALHEQQTEALVGRHRTELQTLAASHAEELAAERRRWETDRAALLKDIERLEQAVAAPDAGAETRLRALRTALREAEAALDSACAQVVAAVTTAEQLGRRAERGAGDAVRAGSFR